MRNSISKTIVGGLTALSISAATVSLRRLRRRQPGVAAIGMAAAEWAAGMAAGDVGRRRVEWWRAGMAAGVAAAGDGVEPGGMAAGAGVAAAGAGVAAAAGGPRHWPLASPSALSAPTPTGAALMAIPTMGMQVTGAVRDFARFTVATDITLADAG